MTDFRYQREPTGPVFTAPFTAISSTNPIDVFCVTPPSAARVALREIRISQYTEFGDAQAELLSIQILTGSTVASSGGAAITPLNVQGHSRASTARTIVTGPSTTLASTTNAQLRLADSMNVAAGWWYRPTPEERIILQPSQIAVVRIPVAPVDSITFNGTLTFQELATSA